jgi:hypothetical protein
MAAGLRVDTGSACETWVIDPALFSGPVNEEIWRGVQNDPASALSYTAAQTMQPIQADHPLQTYRNQLRARTIDYGPPPYRCQKRK